MKREGNDLWFSCQCNIQPFCEGLRGLSTPVRSVEVIVSQSSFTQTAIHSSQKSVSHHSRHIWKTRHHWHATVISVVTINLSLWIDNPTFPIGQRWKRRRGFTETRNFLVNGSKSTGKLCQLSFREVAARPGSARPGPVVCLLFSLFNQQVLTCARELIHWFTAAVSWVPGASSGS